MKNMLKALLGFALVAVLAACNNGPQKYYKSIPEGFEARCQRAIDEWKVPGMAVAVVKDGEVVFMKGFGKAHLGDSLTEPVDVTPQTQFVIASTSKAFTSALPLLSKYLGNGVIYAKALNQIASIYNNKEEGTTALSYYESAIEIFRKFSASDNYSLILTLSNAARAAYNFGEIGRAIAWAEEARHIQTTTNIGFIAPRAWEVLLDSYNRVRNKNAYDIVYEEYREYSNNGLEGTDFAERELYRLYSLGDIEGAIEYLDTIKASHPYPYLLERADVDIDRYSEEVFQEPAGRGLSVFLTMLLMFLLASGILVLLKIMGVL